MGRFHLSSDSQSGFSPIDPNLVRIASVATIEAVFCRFRRKLGTGYIKNLLIFVTAPFTNAIEALDSGHSPRTSQGWKPLVYLAAFAIPASQAARSYWLMRLGLLFCEPVWPRGKS